MRRRVTRHLTLPGGLAGAAVLATMFATTGTANAGIVPTVALGTSSAYSVVAATTVINTNASVIGQSVGLSPGTAIVGFPPAVVLPPGIIDAASPTALQAQTDLTSAYVDAAARGVEFTRTNPDLVGQTLIPGVYAATAKAPLSLSGQLVLDGQNNPNAVFIFQTNSTLITSAASTIALINGASECNVFWEVGSSATLGTGSVFVGNILALTSITVRSAVVVHGRVLARNGAVTLDNDVFTQPSCTPSTATAPPATTAPAATSTTIATATTAPSPETTINTPTTTPSAPTPASASETTTSFDVTKITNNSLPSTGTPTDSTSIIAAAALLLGTLSLLTVKRHTKH